MGRYRATATIVWDFDTELTHDKALEIAKKHLAEIPAQDGMADLRLVLRLDKLKDKIQKVRLGEFKAEEVIPFITKEDVRREYEINGVKHLVRMNSHRYFIFRECSKCVACGLEGKRIFLEHNPTDKSPHFNFYGEEDGKLVLMTKDHIHAKAFGGEDRHSNYQTMCIICNNLKGHANLTIDSVRELRRIYDENKGKVTKKKLHQLIEDAKNKLCQPWHTTKVSVNKRRKMLAQKKASADAVITSCDIKLFKTASEIYAKSVYDADEHDHYACIKKGVYLEPLAVHQGKIMCKLTDDEVFMIPQSLVKVKE